MILELISIAIGRKQAFDRVPEASEWRGILEQANNQALLGVLSPVLDRLPASQKPPLDVYAKWKFTAERIENENKKLNSRCRELYERFSQDGFRSSILKGQGNAAYYPTPSLRAAGDIDILLEGGRKKVLDYLEKNFPVGNVFYHHADAGIFDDVEVEAHFIPSWMNSPLNNHRLQKYYSTNSENLFSHFREELGFCVPEKGCCMVYSLVHVFRHLFAEGVGLRQVMDCYYILLSLDETRREEVMAVMKRLSLKRFTSALMFVLQEVFGLDQDKMLCSPDPERGQFLLDEMMAAGNFGKYDERYRGLMRGPKLKRGLRKQARLVRFFDIAPREVIWAPFFKLKQLIFYTR